ncbi:VanZ family protein [Ammoniphilus sp. YIM 78166]|uniref:VanZ family protein n=1 Tax=Ammoniphilus sp. YIM 78166 TaxID=1644106 RepID=UPI0010700D01|nr:VanZ family protein [Ammoniphilus sp. YIM 78166]
MVYWWRWLPAAGWMGVIFYLSSRTGSELQGMFPFFNSFNFGHVVAYFILSIFFYWALYPFRSGKIDIRLLSVGLCLLYGISDEWHQSFVPGRMPDLFDIVNDVIGASLGMLAVTFFQKKILKR